MKPVSAEVRRKMRVRSRIRKQAADRIRLTVFRSGQHMYAQLIDDRAGKTLACASTAEKELRAEVKNGASVEAAKAVGALVAKRGKELKVERVVFDRGAYLFHGRVKALAEAAREAGLQF